MDDLREEGERDLVDFECIDLDLVDGDNEFLDGGSEPLCRRRRCGWLYPMDERGGGERLRLRGMDDDRPRLCEPLFVVSLVLRRLVLRWGFESTEASIVASSGDGVLFLTTNAREGSMVSSKGGVCTVPRL